MAECWICGIVVEFPPPLRNSHNARVKCVDCDSVRDGSYFDLDIRQPSVAYLSRLSQTRSGMNQYITIKKIHGILVKYPHKRSELTIDSFLYKCAHCGIAFTRYTSILSTYEEWLNKSVHLCPTCKNK
jgi:hypothetical protein